MASFTAFLEVRSISGCRKETPAYPFSSNNPSHVQNFRFSKNNSSNGRVSICSRMISGLEESTVSDLGHNVRSYGQLSATVKQNTTSSLKQSEERQIYYLNTGAAIRTIREEFPGIFHRELTFDIYRDDIVFKDPLNTFIGIENYKSILWGLRFHGKIFFKALWIDIVSVWQPVDHTIMVRWTVHGVPRGPWETHGRFDGTSEYKLDKHGKIFEHKVHNIALNKPPKFRVLVVDELIQSLSCPSTPKPTCFEISSIVSRKNRSGHC